MPAEKSKVVSGLTAMARRGVHIKCSAFLEAIGKLKALAVDLRITRKYLRGSRKTSILVSKIGQAAAILSSRTMWIRKVAWTGALFGQPRPPSVDF
jgi:hypothetical protein